MKLNIKIIFFILTIVFFFVGITFFLFSIDEIVNYIESNAFSIIIVAVFFLFLIFFSVFLALNHFFSPIKKIIETVSKLNSSKKGLQVNLPTKRKDEIGQIYTELNSLGETLLLTSDYASNIKLGRFEDVIEDKIKGNVIGKELIEIKENLITADKERKYRESENKKIQWHQTGIANFSALLQQDFNNIDDLSASVIKALVKYLKVEQGGLFVLEKKQNKDVLVLNASYAYDKKKKLDAEYEIGESLVGKCAKEQKLIRIDDLPEGYTFIGTGLGEDTPKTLLLVPLIFEKILFGVIEIASLKNIPDYKVNLILDVGERIAADIANIKRKIESNKLTEQFKNQAEELEKKEKEALLTISELKKAQAEIAKQSEENVGIMNALISIVSVVFYDLEGRITDINQKNQELYNIKKEDYIGKTHFDFLPEAKENPEWFKQFWEDLRNGKTRTKEYYLKKEDEEMWLQETFTPILNKKGETEKIINIGVDITKQKLLELELGKYKKDND